MKQKGTLIKIFPFKREMSKGYLVDALLIFYRDENGIKRTKVIDRAETYYYMLNDTSAPEAISPPMFIEKDKVHKVAVYSDSLYRHIASSTDSLKYYDDHMTGGSLRNLLKHPLIYDADMDIVDRYIKKFNEEFEPDMNYKLHKVYFDIEVDLMEHGFKKDAYGHIGYSGFPEENEAPCPVNIITLIDEKTMIGYIFAQRNTLNTQLLDYEKVVSEKISQLKDKILNEDGVYFNDIRMQFYSSEEEVIEAFFDTVHQIDPDFALAWNEGFDVLTLQNRLKKLYKRKPEYRDDSYGHMLSKICDSRYAYVKCDDTGKDLYITPKAYYRQNKDKVIVDRMDEFTVLDGIIWIDQMLLFANVRKGKMRESYSLDAIANEELGKEKLDYTGYTIKNLAWLNYERFVEYNFRDTLLLHLLEKENLDIEMLQRLSDITNTRKYKVFKKTICLKNFVSKFAEMQGFIMGNNKNAQYGDDHGEFEREYTHGKKIIENDPLYLAAFDKKENYGAYVGDPNLNDFQGIKTTGGKNSMFIFENVFDEDFASLYPSIIRALNLDKNTQVGKFFLVDEHIKNKLLDEYDYNGLFAVSKNDEAAGEASSSDLGPTLVDSLISHDWNKIGNKYFDLPLTSDMVRDLKGKR